VANKKKCADIDVRESNPEICETFGRLDALYHAATGRRLERSGLALEIIQGLLCTRGMGETEDVWAWWMRAPEYGRDCAGPLDYFADDSIFDDVRTLAFADEAKARLAARASGKGGNR
jgi:hypothetical protein